MFIMGLVNVELQEQLVCLNGNFGEFGSPGSPFDCAHGGQGGIGVAHQVIPVVPRLMEILGRTRCIFFGALHAGG